MAQASKREQILETAGKLFLDQGFNAVSVDQIAAAVPVSKPTLYAHFKDKRDLFIAVINTRCMVLVSVLSQSLETGKTPEEALYKFTREFLDMILRPESLQFHRTMIGESAAFPEMAELFYECGPRRIHTLLSDYLACLHKNKILRVPDPALAADIFLSMVKGHTHFKCIIGISNPKSIAAKDREKIARTVVGVFVRGHSF